MSMDKIEIWDDEPSKPSSESKPTKSPASSTVLHHSAHKTHPVDFENSKKGKPFMRYLYIGLALIVIAFLFVAVFPAYKGYQVYKELKNQGVEDTYVTDMAGLQQAKNTDEEQIANLQSQIATKEQELAAQQQQRAQTEAQASQEQQKLQTMIDTLKTDLEDAMKKQRALESSIEEQDTAIADAARKICCVRRFDDPTIDSYEIQKGKIACGNSLNSVLSC